MKFVSIIIFILLFAVLGCSPNIKLVDLEKYDYRAIFFDARKAFVHIKVQKNINFGNGENVNFTTTFTLLVEKTLKELGQHPEIPEEIGDDADQRAIYRRYRLQGINMVLVQDDSIGLALNIITDLPKYKGYFFEKNLLTGWDCKNLDETSCKRKVVDQFYPIIKDALTRILKDLGYLAYARSELIVMSQPDQIFS